MALLHALVRQPRRFRVPHRVAHANHGLRGAESDGDEAFVREVCDRLGIEMVSGRLEIPGPAERPGESLEMCARRLRHQFLAETARRYGLDAICLAHHGDDQAELFLMRLLRGAGGEGLQGMRWTGPSPANSGVRVVRPMLGCRRDELRGFLAGIGEGFRDDSSNLDLSIPRNAVRHRLLPFLREFGGVGVEGAILRAAELLGAEADLTAAMADSWSQGRLPGEFVGLHEAIQRVVIRRQLIAMGLTPTFEVVESLRLKPLRAVTFAGGRRLICEPTGALRDAPRTRPQLPSPTGREAVQIELGRGAGSSVLPDGSRLIWRVMRPGRTPGRESDARERLDADAVGGFLRIRHWRAGDRFHPLGAPGSSKLQDLFTNKKIAANERRGRWLACAEDGQIVWVEGLPPGDRFRVMDATRNILELGVERVEPLSGGG